MHGDGRYKPQWFRIVTVTLHSRLRRVLRYRLVGRSDLNRQGWCNCRWPGVRMGNRFNTIANLLRRGRNGRREGSQRYRVEGDRNRHLYPCHQRATTKASGLLGPFAQNLTGTSQHDVAGPLAPRRPTHRHDEGKISGLGEGVMAKSRRDILPKHLCGQAGFSTRLALVGELHCALCMGGGCIEHYAKKQANAKEPSSPRPARSLVTSGMVRSATARWQWDVALTLGPSIDANRPKSDQPTNSGGKATSEHNSRFVARLSRTFTQIERIEATDGRRLVVNRS